MDILSDSRHFLQQRFQHFGGPLLNVAAMITDHNSWPRERDELGLHGEQDIEAVATHYKNVLQRNNFDINDAKDQWLFPSKYMPSTQEPWPTSVSRHSGNKCSLYTQMNFPKCS